MSATWFKADHWSNTITTVEVTKETDKFITVFYTGYYKETKTTRRVMKSNEYFPTFREAKEALQSLWVKRQEAAQKEIEVCKKKWTKLFHQEEPDKED